MHYQKNTRRRRSEETRHEAEPKHGLANFAVACRGYGRQKWPLVRKRFEPLVNEHAVALLPRFVLERKRDEISESAA